MELPSHAQWMPCWDGELLNCWILKHEWLQLQGVSLCWCKPLSSMGRPPCWCWSWLCVCRGAFSDDQVGHHGVYLWKQIGDKLILHVDKKCSFPGVVLTTPWMQWLYMLEEVSTNLIYKIICHPCLPILTLNIGVWWSAKMEMIMATPGLWGLLCVPFFMSVNLPVGERGILFDGGIS